jgi:hypothetical protein
MIPFAQSGLEGIMARRRIGRQAFRFGVEEERQTSLDELAGLTRANFVLAPLYPR